MLFIFRAFFSFQICLSIVLHVCLLKLQRARPLTPPTFLITHAGVFIQPRWSLALCFILSLWNQPPLSTLRVCRLGSLWAGQIEPRGQSWESFGGDPESIHSLAPDNGEPPSRLAHSVLLRCLELFSTNNDVSHQRKMKKSTKEEGEMGKTHPAFSGPAWLWRSWRLKKRQDYQKLLDVSMYHLENK